MPKFDYIGETGFIIEVFIPITQDPPFTLDLTIPGETETAQFTRVFTAPAAIYKGEGFNTTDKADSILKWQRENG